MSSVSHTVTFSEYWEHTNIMVTIILMFSEAKKVEYHLIFNSVDQDMFSGTFFSQAFF